MFTIDDYKKALIAIKLSELEEKILLELYNSGYRGMTAQELAPRFEYRSHGPINIIFGILGHKVSDIIGKKPKQRKDSTYEWWNALAEGNREKERGFIWILHPTLRQAIEKILHTVSQENDLGEEIVENVLVEGAVHQRKVNAYERNLKARKQCLEYWGTKCIACGFDFEQKYGELGRGFIHVHHLKSLSELKSSYKVDPKEDLRPICPNCHAILHRRTPPLSLDELEKIIKFDNH